MSRICSQGCRSSVQGKTVEYTDNNVETDNNKQLDKLRGHRTRRRFYATIYVFEHITKDKRHRQRILRGAKLTKTNDKTNRLF